MVQVVFGCQQPFSAEIQFGAPRDKNKWFKVKTTNTVHSQMLCIDFRIIIEHMYLY